MAMRVSQTHDTPLSFATYLRSLPCDSIATLVVSEDAEGCSVAQKEERKNDVAVHTVKCYPFVADSRGGLENHEDADW